MSILLETLLYIDIALAFLMIVFISVRGYVVFVKKTNSQASAENSEEKITQLLIGDLSDIKQLKKQKQQTKKQ